MTKLKKWLQYQAKTHINLIVIIALIAILSLVVTYANEIDNFDEFGLVAQYAP
jgi:hypothetical protein